MSLGRDLFALTLAATTFMVAAFRPVHAASKPRSVVYQQRHVYGVTAHVVTVNLNDPHIRVTVNLAAGGIGSAESMKSFVSRLQPAAAITGTFFDTRTLLPVGDIVSRGRKVYTGPAGIGFCVRPDNTVKFQSRRWGHSPDWSDFRTVLCTGPTLLRRGVNALFPRAEGYRDPSLWALRPRAAVGVTRHNKLLLVAVNKPIHLSDMRHIMKALGAVDAAGLDGGSSTALYAHGRIAVNPGRRLTNLLAIYRTAEPSQHVAIRVTNPRNVSRTRNVAASHRARISTVAAKARSVPKTNPLKVALKTSLLVAARTP